MINKKYLCFIKDHQKLLTTLVVIYTFLQFSGISLASLHSSPFINNLFVVIFLCGYIIPILAGIIGAVIWTWIEENTENFKTTKEK